MDWEKAQEMCICPACPSYFNCGEKIAYCMPLAGKSRCIKTERGCVCPGCPVWEKMHFQRDYYCINGSENGQTEQ
jgi:hypothetical protein